MEGLSVLFLLSRWLGTSHVHVVKDENETKIWLTDLSVAINLGYSARELNEIIREARKQREIFLEAWNDHFADRG
jgi:hypothetical protein